MQLSQAAAITHGELHGDDGLFKSVTIDSRRIEDGDLFVAIPGTHYDGHDFIAKASAHGAVGALVSHMSVVGEVPQVRVKDTTTALGQLGAHWRTCFDFPIVAVTGSNGKTTVSGLIASILNQSGDCITPHNSFNNHWGVPLTLLRIRKHHTHAVIEMGMNQPGEIAYLSGLAQPDIALINNVATAHLAGFGCLQHIADAKAEIFTGLKRTGIAVLNADDPYYQVCLRHIGKREVLRFGVRGRMGDASTDISADIPSGTPSKFELKVDRQHAHIRLKLLGKHNVRNALAAAAASHAAGATLPEIKAGLEGFTAIKGRLNPLKGINGAQIIDDTYNANPASSMAALDVLADFSGERIAVFGGMAELGAQSDSLHHQVGAHARRCGIDHWMSFGASRQHYASGFGAGAEYYDDLKRLTDRVVPLLSPDTTVLVKGSRSAAMERVVEKLTTNSPAITLTGINPC